MATGGGGSFPAPPGGSCAGSGLGWSATGGATLDANINQCISDNGLTITVGGVPVAYGTRPASAYNAVWTRDHAYTLWHNPGLYLAADRRTWAAYFISRRSTGAESDPDGGTLPADFIPDRIDTSGNATYKNAGYSDLPFMDGIAFVILALWADWTETGSAATFTANQAAIDDCLAAIPRSVNGCVYSDPASPSVDYGFTDGVKKTGDVAYGTALQAWAYRMCDDMDPGGSSTAEGDTYANLAAHARDGLATLRQSSGWYKGSSGNNASVDDVWVTALAVAEGLIDSGADCRASAQAIVDAYSDGSNDGLGYVSTITQYGLVRHLPVGQFWTGTTIPGGTYQNGGYWATPVWDCIRAVDAIDPALARQWRDEVMAQFNAEHTAEGDWSRVPYEWHNHGVGVGAKGYTPHAALAHRFV